MDRFAALAMTAALTLFASNAAAHAATLTYTDGECEYRLAYDAKKIDRARLKATFDYLASSSPLDLGPTLATQDDVRTIDLPAYRARCVDHRNRLETPKFIEPSIIEALRKREVEELGTHCRRVEAKLAAAEGDLAPARAQAPSCTRYTDLLALPVADLKRQWNDLVVDLCHASTEPNVCAGHLQRQGEGPGSETRRQLAVLERWVECAEEKPPSATGAFNIDNEKRRLRDMLARRFKAKVLSCAQ